MAIAISAKPDQDVRDKVTSKLAWFGTAAAFALFVAPTFISYKPYQFTWDDADYLLRAIAVSRSFWSGDVHGLGAAMVSWHTPAMTLLGLPWGPLKPATAAGDCFLTLAVLSAMLAAVCLHLLLRSGVKPIFLIVASACVGASLGPYQAGSHAIHMHDLATRFLADNLFAWEILATVLLIPYEAAALCPSLKSTVVRGVLYASLFSLGALTKASFLYFIALVFPILLFMRLRAGETRKTVFWLTAIVGCATPTAIYFLRYGRSAIAQGEAASFGGLADFYHVPLLRFLADTVLESPGMVCSLLLLATAGIYLLLRKRPSLADPRLLPLMIMIGFLCIVLASPSKQVRYLFPAIVTLPFLVSALMSTTEDSVSTPRAALVAGLVCLGLIVAALPTRQRSYQQGLAIADAVLAQAERCDAKSVLLATDGPTLNIFLLNLSSELSLSKVRTQTLAYQAMSRMPIEDDFKLISSSDIVAFQDPILLRPKFTNQRVAEYQKFIRQLGSPSVRVADGTSVYSTHCEFPEPTASR